MSVWGDRQTYAVAWPVPKGHKWLTLIVIPEKTFRNKLVRIRTPELWRSMEVEVGKVNQHGWFQDNMVFAGSKLGFAVDNSKSGVYSGMQSVDFHYYGIQVGHLGIDAVEIVCIDRVNFFHKFL